jgi:hypothetical protein
MAEKTLEELEQELVSLTDRDADIQQQKNMLRLQIQEKILAAQLEAVATDKAVWDQQRAAIAQANQDLEAQILADAAIAKQEQDDILAAAEVQRIVDQGARDQALADLRLQIAADIAVATDPANWT